MRYRLELRIFSRFTIMFFLSVMVLFSFKAQAQNIDPNSAGCNFAWGENVGWINFKPAQGPGVTVADTAVSGMAWGENIGWINLSPDNGGVVNDGKGNLSGYAWGENVGWINFKPTNGGVSIGSDGKFSGQAWGENIGWINFSASNACVKTAWTAASADTVPPIISGTPINIVTEATVPTGALVKYVLPTATDAVDGSVAVSCAPASGGIFATGTTTVTCSASDKSGNTAISTFTVTVRDTTSPVITSPGFISAQAASSIGIAVSYTVTAVDIVDGSVPVSCNPLSGSLFSLGTATVNCSAGDKAGNTSFASFTVTVLNITPNAFAFTAQTDVTRNTLVTSNTIAVTGINAASPISIIGGSYSINGGTFVSVPGFVSDGDAVQVQQTSSGSYLTATNAVLTMGSLSAAFSVTTKTNTLPTALAGMGQTVHAGKSVTLDGSGSTDSDGDSITYAWTFITKPNGSSAILSDAGAVKPVFTADLPGNYVIQLVVTDSFGAESATAQVTISTTNTPPVADAGQDQAVTVIGTSIQVDGSKSWDPDGDQITYQWKFTSVPAGSSAVLSNPTSATPNFIADEHGTYTVQLIVSDPWAQSAPATVTISFSNVKPVANAGTSRSAVVGDTVTLNGGGSSDANGDPLTYQWSITSAPAGSLSKIASPTSKVTAFVPDFPGLYVVQLVVNDGFVNSDPSSIQVQVISRKTEAIDAAQNIGSIIISLDGVLFKNPNMKNALINKLNAVIANISDGNYSGALDQLQNDILGKMDGCALAGAPDKNDWIINCQGQSQVYPSIVNLIQLVQTMK